MVRRQSGFAVVEWLIGVAIVLLIVAIVLPIIMRGKEMTISGYVRNQNIISYQTFIAFEKEGDDTPFAIEFRGVHPELWKGQHVRLSLNCPENYRNCTLLKVERLGPDVK